MRLTSIFWVAAAIFLLSFSGCSERNYFEPQELKGSVQYDGELPADIVETGYAGATLANGQVITKKGLQSWRLPKGYRYINRQGPLVIAAGDCKPNILYNLDTNQTVKIDLPRRIVAASLIPESDNLAFLIEGNRYGLYDYKKGKIVALYDSDKAITADIRIANPIMLDQLVIVPTLDGKLVIMNKETGAKIREIVVGEGKEFNNVIYLHIIGNRLVAATPHRIISVSPRIMDSQSMEISDVIFIDDNIYIFAKDGTIYHCDTDLKILGSKKFPFAHFVGVIYSDFIYALERQGYIIATDPELSMANVFQFPDKIDTWLFTTPDAIYYDKYYFKLNLESEKGETYTQEGSREDENSTEASQENAEKSLSIEGIWKDIKSLISPDDANETEGGDE